MNAKPHRHEWWPDASDGECQDAASWLIENRWDVAHGFQKNVIQGYV